MALLHLPSRGRQARHPVSNLVLLYETPRLNPFHNILDLTLYCPLSPTWLILYDVSEVVHLSMHAFRRDDPQHRVCLISQAHFLAESNEPASDQQSRKSCQPANDFFHAVRRAKLSQETAASTMVDNFYSDLGASMRFEKSKLCEVSACLGKALLFVS